MVNINLFMTFLVYQIDILQNWNIILNDKTHTDILCKLTYMTQTSGESNQPSMRSIFVLCLVMCDIWFYCICFPKEISITVCFGEITFTYLMRR